LHGFTNNGTTFPSPIGLSASFDTALVSQVAGVIASEAEGLGVSQLFAPVLDLSRELRWGRVEENFGEDHFLTGEIGNAYVTGLQSGKRRNASSTAIARVASTCKHFAAFGSPQSGLSVDVLCFVWDDGLRCFFFLLKKIGIWRRFPGANASCARNS
jgi:beta-glucosidase